MSEERRRFFRINDTIGVSYRRLGPEEAKAFSQRSAEHGGNFDYASNFDNRIQTLLDACRVQNPLAAELLDLMNKKLNFVIRQLDVDSNMLQQIAYDLKQVNVSACGMAFAVAEPLQKGDCLQLDILLQPSDLHVVAMAEVVACEALPEALGSESQQGDEGHLFMRLNFIDMHPNDQELLIQHVVKRQSAQLKARRETGVN